MLKKIVNDTQIVGGSIMIDLDGQSEQIIKMHNNTSRRNKQIIIAIILILIALIALIALIFIRIYLKN
jgi:hypothetical protein